MKPRIRFAALGGLAAAAFLSAVFPATSAEIPTGWQAQNVVPVAHDPTPVFKLAIRQTQGRWFLYGASLTEGVFVLDVTDPAKPVVLNRLATPPNTMEVQVTLHDDLMITGMSRIFTTQEQNGSLPDPTSLVQPPSPPNKTYSEGVRLWSLKDPAKPVELSRWGAGGLGVHRNGYPGGRYAFLSSTAPGFRGFLLIILDVSNPKAPREAGRWWYPGQGAAETPGKGAPGFHGPAVMNPDGKTLTAPYTPGVVTLDISDPSKPALVGKLDLVPPIADTGTQSVHTALPVQGGKLIYFNSESKAPNCKEAWQGAGLIDNSDPKNPYLLSIFPRPVPPADAPYRDFCDKGGRFGPHNTNNEIHSPDVASNDELIYLTYFNAGVRIYDIRDPRQPTEVGWFIPPNPTKPAQSQVGEIKVNQTQDVLVDTRGYAYLSDSAWGLWIVRYTGPGAK